jgi:RNA polymerase sigma-54 factor
MRALLARLEMVAGGEVSALRVALGCDQDDLDNMLAELQTLAPRPGLAFDAEMTPARAPEVRVTRAADGGWTLEATTSRQPRLLVREREFSRLAARCRRPDELRYLQERLLAARHFADLIARRRRTVLDVAGEIVRRQAAFLADGPSALRPLMMKTVATALGLHESTISRTVADKAMETPRGVLAFKAFFAAAARTLDGSEQTQRQVIARIGALIAWEARTGVILSDDAIADQLYAEGIRIARRTVAKHREGLGLQTSARRKAALASGMIAGL